MNMADKIKAEINDLKLIHEISWTLTHSPHFYSRFTFDTEDDLKSEYMVVVLEDNVFTSGYTINRIHLPKTAGVIKKLADFAGIEVMYTSNWSPGEKQYAKEHKLNATEGEVP